MGPHHRGGRARQGGADPAQDQVVPKAAPGRHQPLAVGGAPLTVTTTGAIRQSEGRMVRTRAVIDHRLPPGRLLALPAEEAASTGAAVNPSLPTTVMQQLPDLAGLPA